MLRQILAPIHPDGWKFVAIAAAATIVLFVVAIYMLYHSVGPVSALIA